MRPIIWFAVLYFSLSMGCGARPVASEVVPFTDVSPELLIIAQKAAPTVKFKSARRRKVNGADIVEIRGTLPNGKVRELQLSTDGKILAAY